MTGNANTPRNVILNADCIEAMRSFDRGAVDFILTDPPYVTTSATGRAAPLPMTTTAAGFARPSTRCTGF
ncbi:hypothetical protein [Pseudochelatococcus contaminans]|uniref:Site-specific DNA-adenine methylase n=1 Tax=Pseudochelatococcus contaminans TaxID=1538103 RepID=A0A7W6EI22_9HYPH|nr:site-specific DNA-adenine methylase [Pseudochelatococcus contaminans]